MKLRGLVVALAAALALAPAARAYEVPPLLNEVARVYSLGVGEVRCPSEFEWEVDTWAAFSWAYTNLRDDYVVLSPVVCEGALSVGDAVAPLWQQALGPLGLIAVPAAAAGPGIIHLEFSGTFTDPDFCGSGETVNIAVAEHGTLFIDPNRPGVDESLTLEGRTVFTNPLNGETVVIHFAGARQNMFPGDPGRVIETDIGLRTQIVHQGPGGVLTRDAGYVVVDFTFSIIGGEIVLERGPHPFIEDLVEGNDTFCGLVTSALGLG